MLVAQAHAPGNSVTNARQIADERFARGEIDAAQHAAIVSVLASATEPAKEERELTPFGAFVALCAAINFTVFLGSLFFLNSGAGKVIAVIFGLVTVIGWLTAASCTRPKKARPA
jgi:hypothetical protein